MSRVREMCASLIAALALLVPLAEEPLLQADGPTRQRVVVFDEGHFNFHTTRGSYSQFAELLRKDGYTIIARPDPVDRKALAQAQLLVIANALSAEGNSAERETLPWRWTHNAAMPAFTSNECDGGIWQSPVGAQYRPLAVTIARMNAVELPRHHARRGVSRDTRS